MSLSEILDYSLLKIAKYELKVAMLVGIVFVLLLNYVILYIIRVITERKVSEDYYIKGRLVSINLLVKYILWTISISLIFAILKINVTFILAGSTALLVGLGIGVQQIFKDIVSGIFILMEGTIKVRDVLQVDDTFGRVVNIKLRTTELLTRDGTHVIVPNGKFITENVKNWSHHEKIARFVIRVRVAYDADVDLARKILLDMADRHENVISNDDERPIVVRMTDFEEDAIILELKFWTGNVFTSGIIRSDLRFEIYSQFKKNGIKFPFPQRDIHIKNQNKEL